MKISLKSALVVTFGALVMSQTAAMAQNYNNTTPMIIIFKDYDQSGEKRKITENLADLGPTGFLRKASSLNAIGTWEICTGINFSGNCVQVSGEIGNLDRFDDAVSSVRFVGWNKPQGQGPWGGQWGNGGYGNGGYGNGGYGNGGYGNGGYGNGGYGNGGYGNGGGWGNKQKPSRGIGVTFFPGPIEGFVASKSHADKFCRNQGFYNAVYYGMANNYGQSGLADVLCK